MKTEQIIVHVKPEIKADAMAIFRKIGISASEAVNLFLTHIVMEKGIPPDMHIPNEDTLRAFQDSDSRKNMPLRMLYSLRIKSDYDATEVNRNTLEYLLQVVEEVIHTVDKKGVK